MNPKYEVDIKVKHTHIYIHIHKITQRHTVVVPPHSTLIIIPKHGLLVVHNLNLNYTKANCSSSHSGLLLFFLDAVGLFCQRPSARQRGLWLCPGEIDKGARRRRRKRVPGGA